MDYFDRIMETLGRWNHLGRRDVSNGTQLIGHIPHVAPLAYLHVVFGGLSDSQINQIEVGIKRELPEMSRAFYRRANGCSLFGGAISIYGLRFNYDRGLEDEARQPFDVVLPNRVERAGNANVETIIFGGYNRDGSRLAFAPDHSVFMCPPATRRPILSRWDDFETMLVSEVERLAALFDADGRRIDPSVSTLPPSALTVYASRPASRDTRHRLRRWYSSWFEQG